MTELKPCPFCGHDKPRLKRNTGVTGVATKTRWLREQVKCRCGAASKIGKKPGQAIDHWNRRVEP